MPSRESVAAGLRRGRAAARASVAAAAIAAAGCTPDVPRDPVPEEMVYDLQSQPPNVPQPTVLVVNPTTRRIDFSQAGVVLPPDCAVLKAPPPTGAPQLSQAECEFDQYLQSLDGFPTVTPATAPASAALDPATLTPGTNVVVVNATTGAVVPDAKATFDATTGHLVVRPARSWSVGATYWIGVRGYGNGVRAVGGKQVVGSSTHALLKQPMSLTCMAVPPGPIAASCPGLQLLSQSYDDPATAMQLLFQLEPVRQIYQASGGFELMAAAGLPREEVAVLWGFPVHSSSVAELDPTANLVPSVTAPNEIRVAVQGTVDPASVKAAVLTQNIGTVLLMDLTAAATDLVMGIPPAQATYAAGSIVITTAAPLVAGHQYGVFMTNGLVDSKGAPLVPSPISVLLSLQGTLVDAATGHSTISTVADADAVQLEAGRSQLAVLFNDPHFKALTGVGRDNLVYAFAFPLGGTP